MKWIIGLIFFVGLGAGALLVLMQSHVKQRVSRSADTSAVDPRPDTDRQVEQLRREVAALRVSQASIASVASSREAAPTTDAQAAVADEPRDPEQVLMEAQAQRQAKVKVIEDGYTDERPDPAWSASARDQLIAAYSDGALAGIHVQAECKSSLCRLDIALDAPELAGDGAAQLIANKTPWPNKGYMRLDSKTGRGVFYIAREGHELPESRAPQ